MVLYKPLLPLRKTGLREVEVFLKCSVNCHRRSRKEEPIVWAFGCVSIKISVRGFALNLRSTSTQFSAPSAKKLPGLGAGRKNSSTEKKLRTISLDRTMSPQSALSNACTPRDEKLVQEQKDGSNVNCAENSDDYSEVDREPSSNGEKLDSRSPSGSLNFARLELPSGGESKEVSSQAAEAEFSGNKLPPADEDSSAILETEGMTPSSRRVAVIGAGAAGLVAARELLREGLEVVIFEQGEEVGGVWQYDPRVEDDQLGIDPNRSRVHSSMYHSLRTNLPREIMGYLDYPFLPKDGEGRDDRRYPDHREVAKYLEDFSEAYNLRGLVKFGVRVDYAGQQVVRGSDTKWVVKFQRTCDFEIKEEPGEKDCQHAEPETEVFDAVVVCNGHYAEPRLAHIPGIESWPGVQVHSHNYRFPHPFQDKVVVVVGSGNSAQDITSEIAVLAKEVHQCARAWSSIESLTEGKGPQHNIWQQPMVTKACSDGTVEYQDGKSVVADIILYCTGYFFSFPFLDTKGYISVEDNRVDPLYKHVFPPALAPELSFVGVPWKVVPFPLMELQSRWIARLLSGKSFLPSECEMISDIKNLYEQLGTMNYPKSYTHNCDTYQYEYGDWLAQQSGHELVETWRKEIYASHARNRVANPSTYRDNLEDQYWFEVAMASLEKVAVPSKGPSIASARVT